MLSGPKFISATTMCVVSMVLYTMDILTPSGWVPSNLASVGDEVIIIDDTRQEKLSGSCAPLLVNELLEGELYEVGLSDGTSTIASLGTQFEVRVAGVRGNLVDDWSLKTLEELLEWFPPLVALDDSSIARPCPCDSKAYLSSRYELRQVQYYLPFNTQDLSELPPYWVGVLASIGCLEDYDKEPSVYLSREQAQRMRDQGSWKFFLVEPRPELIRSDLVPMKYDFSSYTTINGRSKLSIELENLQLMGKSIMERFIHPSYVFTDFYDRVNLLQGIMDSIGYVDPVDSYTRLNTRSYALAENVVFLVRSIGGYAYKKRVTSGVLSNWIVTVFMPLPEVPFSLPSKAIKYHFKEPVIPPLYLESIEPKSDGLIRNLVVSENGAVISRNNLLPVYRTVY